MTVPYPLALVNPTDTATTRAGSPIRERGREGTELGLNEKTTCQTGRKTVQRWLELGEVWKRNDRHIDPLIHI